jgi:hypothetical protein
MKTEIRTLLTSRGITMPGGDEIEQLHRIQDRWQSLDARRKQVLPSRVEEDQKAAYTAFMADPSPENEMQLAITADTNQMLLRYATRHKALTEYMKLVVCEAAELFKPFQEAASKVLHEELEQRRQNKTTLYTESDPAVKQCRAWVDEMSRAGTRLLNAHCGHYTPAELAKFFLEDGE